MLDRIDIPQMEKLWLVTQALLVNELYGYMDEAQFEEHCNVAASILIGVSFTNRFYGPYDHATLSIFSTRTPSYFSLASATTTEIGIDFALKCAILKKLHPDWSMVRVFWEASKEMVHVGLDALGLVPGIGEIFDITNGVLYTLEGDGVNAAFSYSASVPFFGWGATVTKYGTKVAVKTIELANGAKRTLKWFKQENGIITFGIENSGQFRALLGLTPGDVRQAHHIIPWELANDGTQKVIQMAAKTDFPFHVQDILNGIPLSTVQHNGSHAAYTEKVRQALRQIETQHGSNLTPQIAFQEIVDLTNRIKAQILANPTVSINNLNF
jgi:hypothetical protein